MVKSYSVARHCIFSIYLLNFIPLEDASCRTASPSKVQLPRKRHHWWQTWDREWQDSCWTASNEAPKWLEGIQCSYSSLLSTKLQSWSMVSLRLVQILTKQKKKKKYILITQCSFCYSQWKSAINSPPLHGVSLAPLLWNGKTNIVITAAKNRADPSTTKGVVYPPIWNSIIIYFVIFISSYK